MGKIILSVLELGSHNGVQSIVEDIIPYALQAEKYNFERYWIGEHYLSKSQWYNPDILLPLLAGSTDKISIGTAGVLLSYRNVYRTVLDYKMLNSLFPNRIQLGLAKGGIEPEIEKLLIPDYNDTALFQAERFEKNFKLLMDFYQSHLGNKKEPELFIPPFDGKLPQLWYLSSTLPKNVSDEQLSKLSYCLSFFHNPHLTTENMASKIDEIRETYLKRSMPIPKISIAFAGACIKKDENIEKKWSILKENESVCTYHEIYGNAKHVREQIEELHYKFEINDFVYYNKLIEPKEKKESLKLIAKELNL